VPEATHHAGTANVTAARTAITVAATQRLASTLLIVNGHLLSRACHENTVPSVLYSGPVSTSAHLPPERSDFIRDIVAADLRAGRIHEVVTRFPPEPNGYLHIGHAKSICLNFGIPQEFGGRCHLRFDDTNPIKEEQEYIDAIEADVHWLGFDWGEHLYFASDYFEQLYEWAVDLIEAGKAYVDDLSADEIREHRGTLTEPGRPSPWRDRPADESLDLFARMRAGEFPDGARVLRAKIDMASPNINLRDPVLYRILHAEHPRTGDAWCIYPMYDFAHGQSDAIEHITHSLCTLEFEAHRPLYDWFIRNLPVPAEPHQYEFARLNLTHTVLSKRVLKRLVAEGTVRGWDDPRMPTLSGIRRRGFPAEGIRDFATLVGVAKTDSVVEVEYLEHTVRDVLNRTALRRFAVLDPLKVVITDYPEGQVEEMDVPNNPEDPDAGTRRVPFGGELWIERDDFMEEPVRKFFRLAPGREVRLRSAYFVTCTEVVKDDAGNIVELRCTHDPATRGGDAPDGRRPKATLHWVSAAHAVPAEVRLYEHLFTDPYPGADGRDVLETVDPESEKVLSGCFVEPSLVGLPVGETVQFERLGYFCPDPDSTPGALVFNRALTLKDTWAKLQKQGRHDTA
jgi:glutaminyl-tRNA synthetase